MKTASKTPPFRPADEVVKFGKPEWGHPTYCCLARIQGPREGFQGSHDEVVWWFKTVNICIILYMYVHIRTVYTVYSTGVNSHHHPAEEGDWSIVQRLVYRPKLRILATS